MTRERLDGWCEKLVAALVLAILVFGPLALGGVRPRDFAIIQWLTAGAGLLWVVRLWLNPAQPVLWTPVSWAVIAFMALAGVCYATAEVEYVAREEVLKILTYGVLFLVISNNLSRQKYEKAVAVTLMVMAVALSLYAIYQYVTQSQFVWQYLRPAVYVRRGSGTYFNPNHLAGFLEMVVPLGIAFCALGRIKPMARIAAGYAAVMALAGIGVSLSRGGWLATAGSLVVLFLLLIIHRVHRAVSVAALIFLVLAGGLFLAQSRSGKERLAEMFHEGRLEDIRFKVWEPATRIWQDHFWFGAGPAHFDIQFRQYRPPGVQMRPDRAHNDYLNTLADWGVVGGVFVALPWLLLMAGLWRSWGAIAHAQNTLEDIRSNRLALAIGAIASLAAILAHSVTDFNMHIPANAIVVVTLMALLTGLTRHGSQSCLKWPVSSARLVLSVSLIAACALLVAIGIHRWHEEQLLAKANRLRDLPAAMCAELEAAFTIEPHNSATAYKIGEGYRLQSWEGESNYAPLAERAMQWYGRAMELQPYDPYPLVGTGMCLDWLDRHQEAEPWFHRALKMDPNNFFVLAHLGWHYVQAGDYHAAQPWLERSLSMRSWDNAVAEDYLNLVKRRLAEEEATRPRGK